MVVGVVAAAKAVGARLAETVMTRVAGSLMVAWSSVTVRVTRYVPAMVYV
jgi:hypothetical protein